METKNEVTKIETWLPVFPGFYGTYYEPDESCELEGIASERHFNSLPELIHYDMIKFDYKDYKNEIAENAVYAIENDLSEFVESIKFQKIKSPKYYNFSNDSIDIEITLTAKNINSIMDYLDKNSKNFQEYLTENYTSRSGFISHYSNDFNDWFSEDSLTHNHKLGAILNFIWYNEDNSEDDFYEACMMDAHLSAVNYFEATTMHYCYECGNWIQNYPYPNMIGGLCQDCAKAGKKSGEYIVCGCCGEVLNNKWEQRQYRYKVKHGLINPDKIICSVCAVKRCA